MNEETKQPEECRADDKKPSAWPIVIKEILGFLSKSLYPAIIVYVIFMLKPTLAEIDIPALVNRMQSAEGAGYKFTFAQAADVGAETAPLNSKITELQKALATINGDLEKLQNRLGAQIVSEEARKERALEQSIFERNSRYKVLVFHGSPSRSQAQQITTTLLNAGYSSSSTETDFSELGITHPEGTVYITHNTDGESIYQAVAKLIDALGLDITLEVQPTTTNLRRGEVQVLVF